MRSWKRCNFMSNRSRCLFIALRGKQCQQHQVLSGNLVGGGDASLQGKRLRSDEHLSTASIPSRLQQSGSAEAAERCGRAVRQAAAAAAGRGFSSSSSDCPRMNEQSG